MKRKEPTGEPTKSGEFVWRSVRYAAVCLAGYLFGLMAGSQVTEGPMLWVVGIVGAVALMWVFRSGRKSVLHAASDAVAAAQATAQAHASATNVVQLGHQNYGPYINDDIWGEYQHPSRPRPLDFPSSGSVGPGPERVDRLGVIRDIHADEY